MGSDSTLSSSRSAYLFLDASVYNFFANGATCILIRSMSVTATMHYIQKCVQLEVGALLKKTAYKRFCLYISFVQIELWNNNSYHCSITLHTHTHTQQVTTCGLQFPPWHACLYSHSCWSNWVGLLLLQHTTPLPSCRLKVQRNRWTDRWKTEGKVLGVWGVSESAHKVIKKNGCDVISWVIRCAAGLSVILAVPPEPVSAVSPVSPLLVVSRLREQNRCKSVQFSSLL